MNRLYESVLSPQQNKIIAIGRNYIPANSSDAPPAEPIIFTKPASSIVRASLSSKLQIQPSGRDILHEIELGVLIGRAGRNIKESDALTHVGGYFLALDLTDKQYFLQAREKGLPWDLAKGQDGFCPVSELIDVEKVRDPHALTLHLAINGKTVQKDLTGAMHFKVDKLISFASQFMTLNPGDIILTGTPSGIGPVIYGDNIDAKLIQGDNQVLAEILVQLVPKGPAPKL